MVGSFTLGVELSMGWDKNVQCHVSTLIELYRIQIQNFLSLKMEYFWSYLTKQK